MASCDRLLLLSPISAQMILARRIRKSHVLGAATTLRTSISSFVCVFFLAQAISRAWQEGTVLSESR